MDFGTEFKELYENQMSLEMDELEVNPEGELKEIELIYRAKGIPAGTSRTNGNRTHE